MRPLFVGEDNPYGSDPRYALYPEPASGRLCHLVMGLSVKEYIRRFDRVNLCAGRWSAGEARDRAKDVAAEYRSAVVFLGAKVCRAFDFEYEPFTCLTMSGMARRIVILPHPSGRCRAWNEAGAYDCARAVLREAGVLPFASPMAGEAV